jgi:hypothetical protein
MYLCADFHNICESNKLCKRETIQLKSSKLSQHFLNRFLPSVASATFLMYIHARVNVISNLRISEKPKQRKRTRFKTDEFFGPGRRNECEKICRYEATAIHRPTINRPPIYRPTINRLPIYRPTIYQPPIYRPIHWPNFYNIDPHCIDFLQPRPP